MRGDVVPAARELADAVGMVARRHAEDEEGRLGAKRVEEIEHAADLALERLPPAVPLGVAEAPGEDLCAVREVEAQEQGPAGHELTMPSAWSSLRYRLDRSSVRFTGICPVNH